MNEEQEAIVAEEMKAAEELAETPPSVDTEEVVEEVETKGEDVSEEVSEPPESSPEKKEDGVQKRIDKLTREKYEAKRDADYWKAKAETPPEVKPEVVAMKKLADFDYDEDEYTAYLKEDALIVARAAVESERQGDSQARKTADFNAREAEFDAKVDDYEKVTRRDLTHLNLDTVEAIKESEEGPAILYYLGKNPDVARKLFEMSPLSMARELGRIEATKLAPPEPSTTNAPAPPPKIKGGDNTVRVEPTSAASDKLSDDEWLKRRNKQVFS